MSAGEHPKPLNITERRTTIEEYTRFCEEEKERRMNSGEDFDEQAFGAAVELTLRKLKTLEEEGWV